MGVGGTANWADHGSVCAEDLQLGEVETFILLGIRVVFADVDLRSRGNFSTEKRLLLHEKVCALPHSEK